MDDGSQRRDDAGAVRHLGIAMRLVLYPLALGLIVLAWQQYHGGSSEADPPVHHGVRVVVWRGVTSQGEAMTAHTRSGRLVFFDMQARERCSDGSRFTSRWYPGEHRFAQRGEYVVGRQFGSGSDSSGEPDRSDNSVSARIDAHPSGTVRVQDELTRRGRTVRCDSGPVTFELHRTLG
jgi:hypothetical protein